MKGTLRHAWQPLLGFLIVGVALAYQLIFVVAKAGRGTAVSSQGILYVLLAVVTINLFRVFLNRTPVFRMEAASVMLTYNTKQFYKVLCRKQGLSVLLSIFIAGVLSFILSGFLFDAALGKLFGLLALYGCNCSFLSWIFYHSINEQIVKTAQGASKKRKLFGRKSQFIAFFTTQRLQRNRGFCAFFRICSFIVPFTEQS